MTTREYIVRLNDFHVPYHDERAIKAAFAFVKHLKPKIIVIDEVVDFYALSRFDKDPHRKLRLQEELDVARSVLKELRKASPKSEIIMVESNHDVRLKRYLNNKAEELSGLRCLSFESLLGLKELNIKYVTDYMYKDFLFKHGTLVRQHSGYTAKGELDREGCSGCSAHTHRASTHYKTLRGGSYMWMECGCLCTLSPDYVTGTANWQQAVGVVGFEAGESKRFYATVLPIIDYTIMWGRRTFKG